MKLLSEFNGKQRKILFLLFVFAVGLSLYGLVSDGFQEDTSLKRIKRPASYEGGQEINFGFNYEGETKEESVQYSGIIGEKKLSMKEAKGQIEESFKRIEKGMFREGENRDHVRTGIHIPDSFPESPVHIRWEAEDVELFQENGEIEQEKLGREPRRVNIRITAEYGEIEKTKEYSLTLVPMQMEEEERVRLEILEKLSQTLESSEEETVILPEVIAGREIHYVIPKKEMFPGLVGLGIGIVFVAFFTFKKENERRKEKRERELKEAYPYFVGRFVILLGAGLNLLGIWRKLLETENINESLSQEIRLTLQEIGNGKTEREAYENFGKRTGGLQYQKFVSILTENLKMGSSQILIRLGAEAKEALLARKYHAREIGETLGAKFLMPMMLELVLIMVMIMLPAMLSAQI